MRNVADGLALLHGCFVVVLLACPYGVYAFRHNDVLLLVMAAVMCLTLVSWRIFGGCPLTRWENRLRQTCDPTGCYSGPCVNHYAKRLFRLNLPRWTVHALVVGSLAASLFIRFAR